jgi:hypothetical protein
MGFINTPKRWAIFSYFVKKKLGDCTAEAPRSQRKKFLVKNIPISVNSASLWWIFLDSKTGRNLDSGIGYNYGF